MHCVLALILPGDKFNKLNQNYAWTAVTVQPYIGYAYRL